MEPFRHTDGPEWKKRGQNVYMKALDQTVYDREGGIITSNVGRSAG